MKIMKCTISMTKSWQIMQIFCQNTLITRKNTYGYNFTILSQFFSFRVNYVPTYPIAGLYSTHLGEIVTVEVKTLGMHKTALWELVSFQLFYLITAFKAKTQWFYKGACFAYQQKAKGWPTETELLFLVFLYLVAKHTQTKEKDLSELSTLNSKTHI